MTSPSPRKEDGVAAIGECELCGEYMSLDVYGVCEGCR